MISLGQLCPESILGILLMFEHLWVVCAYLTQIHSWCVVHSELETRPDSVVGPYNMTF